MSNADPHVFIHIGKTAGTALRGQISKHFSPERVCPLVFHQEIVDLPSGDRAKYDIFCAHIGYKTALTLTESPDRIFSMMREPVDRVLSLYYYWRESESMTGGPAIAKQHSLDDFLDSDRVAIINDLHNTQTWQLAVAHDVRTRNIVKKSHSEDWVYEQAIQNIKTLGAIGVQEKLGSFVQSLNRKYEWSLDLPDRLNETVTRKSSSLIASSTLDKIKAITAMDIELYNHVVENHIGNRE